MNAASLPPRAVDHYENFPVASWLCPPALRPPIAAIYWFARTADDIADEGTASAAQRIEDLVAYRADLHRLGRGEPVSPRWAAVFGPLGEAVRVHRLPLPLLEDLLSAFEQDVVKTAAGAGYAGRAELLDYCRRSANPIGRLLLHLYGVRDELSLARSDAICSALQLINFWQDLSVDLPRGRYYLPQEDLLRFRMDPADPASWPRRRRARVLLAHEVAWARSLMKEGAPLVHAVPGRAGWELRLVVQGGLRILDKIAAGGFDSFVRRPRLRGWDALPLLARAARM